MTGTPELLRSTGESATFFFIKLLARENDFGHRSQEQVFFSFIGPTVLLQITSLKKIIWDINCKKLVRLHDRFFCASSNYQLQKIIWYTDHKETDFLEYFFSTMFQMTKLRKLLWTLITRKWFLSCMGSSIHLQITNMRKWIWTKITRKGLLSTMGSSVLL